MPLPDFEAWAIFARVAERGSFSCAADELGLSKATVSKAIARLEARLGTPLLHRTSRRLSLTASGRAARDKATALLAAGEDIEEEATQRAAEPRGMVRMSAPVALGVRHVAPLIAEFLDDYPQVRIDLRLSDAFVDIVGEGYDLALRIGRLEDSSLRARRLCDVPRPLVAAPEYWKAHGRPEHPRDLAHHVGLLYSNLAQPDHWSFVDADGHEESVRVPGRMLCNDGDALIPALLAGKGTMPLPGFYVDAHLATGALEAAMPGWSVPPIGLHIVTPPGNVRPRRVTLLVDYLTRELVMAPWARVTNAPLS